MTLYHVTKTENLEKIMEEGLVPRIGDMAADCNEKEEKIYLFPDEQSMNEALGSWLGLWYEDNYGEDVELCSLEINVPDDFPIIDGEVEYEKYSYRTISSEYIKFFREE